MAKYDIVYKFFNPYHDEKGRFARRPGGPGADLTKESKRALIASTTKKAPAAEQPGEQPVIIAKGRKGRRKKSGVSGNYYGGAYSDAYSTDQWGQQTPYVYQGDMTQQEVYDQAMRTSIPYPGGAYPRDRGYWCANLPFSS